MVDLKPGGSDRPDRKPLLDIWEEILSPLSEVFAELFDVAEDLGRLKKPKEDDNLA